MDARKGDEDPVVPKYVSPSPLLSFLLCSRIWMGWVEMGGMVFWAVMDSWWMDGWMDWVMADLGDRV